MHPIYPKSPARAALFSLFILAWSASLPGARGDSYNDAFPTIPESHWIGLRLTILPQSKSLQHYGYQELYRDSDKEFVPLPYAEFVGRVVRVVSIEQGKGPDGERLDEADLQLEGDKKIIHGDIDQGCMNDVAPVSDLDAARKRYLGKTLWLSSDHLSTYDPQKDTSDSPAGQEAFQKIRVKQFSPVKIMDIVPGWYASVPIRFIVQEASGSEGAAGYVDVHMSDTNIPESLRAVGRFEDTFMESDPRKKYLWSPKVWAALENKEIFLGMTDQQVRMSWGEPKEIHKLAGQNHTEQWVYDSTHTLTLNDGALENISRLSVPAK